MKQLIALLGLIIALPLFGPGASAQSTPPAQADELRSVVRLLPGYISQDRDGFDTGAERVWNKDGFEFTFVWDTYSGGAEKIVGKQKIRWRGEQIINGQKAIFVYAEPHLLIVCFPADQAYFSGNIRRDQDLAEMLFMIATYGQKGGYAATPGSTILPKVQRKKPQP